MCNVTIDSLGSGHLHSLGTITVNNVVNLLFPGASTIRASKKYYRIHVERLHQSLNDTYIHSKVDRPSTS